MTIIKLVKFNPVLSFNYINSDITDHICVLCKKNFMESTINNNIIVQPKIVMGKCKHLFHSDCINKYIKDNNNVICPIDLMPWNKDHDLDCGFSFKKQVRSK